MAIFGGRGKQQQEMAPDIQGPGPADNPAGGEAPPTVPQPTQPDAPSFDPAVVGDLGGGSGNGTGEEAPPPPLPMPPMPPPPPQATTNTPLAIPGTFALPGSSNAAPFHSAGFFQNRVVRGPQSFGPGSTVLGGGSGDFSGLGDSGAVDAGGDAAATTNPQEEELIRRIVNGLGRRHA